jgi:hypothetical protein
MEGKTYPNRDVGHQRYVSIEFVCILNRVQPWIAELPSVPLVGSQCDEPFPRVCHRKRANIHTKITIRDLGVFPGEMAKEGLEDEAVLPTTLSSKLAKQRLCWPLRQLIRIKHALRD